ncbi:hypothetical protein HDU91_002353 [Kappamyces sp. JEL0680]|nr:hypothetical protein HDU91_002353 [Kappamyces sp. JEL0680]
MDFDLKVLLVWVFFICLVAITLIAFKVLALQSKLYTERQVVRRRRRETIRVTRTATEEPLPMYQVDTTLERDTGSLTPLCEVEIVVPPPCYSLHGS